MVCIWNIFLVRQEWPVDKLREASHFQKMFLQNGLHLSLHASVRAVRRGTCLVCEAPALAGPLCSRRKRAQGDRKAWAGHGTVIVVGK